MKKYLLLIVFLFCVFTGYSQVGSIELSTGGFSFIPAFTSKEPNIIINAGTNQTKKLTGNIMFMTRVRSMTPNTVVIMTRYKLIDRKFKAILGVHLPAMQVTPDYQVTSFFGQELATSYPISKEWNIGTFTLHGKGRNSDFEALLLAGNAIFHKKSWGVMSQAYYLNVGNLTGLAETLTYDINKTFQLKGFINYTFTDASVIGTVGVKYNL
ncbi:hypothetical protein EOJ36_00725 [Sandaracinomonas limnophila]|uniref:Outer membrane protein beta-barrel domain-containing protein n=1 Tax=Sandaracinomonas limnophila TaxID=1862386 RepID=A0A437PWC8_9BACT|nr:hypothetical protein [Sandaracinomonas limnophila]RVU26549.1 hypothetical protein EOJ36_00725 [Sandaracinomonas limnophila]